MVTIKSTTNDFTFKSDLGLTEGTLPIAHWKMNDDEATSTIVDSLDNNAALQIGNTEDITSTGKINESLDFNGTDWAKTGTASELNLNGKDATVCAWVYFNTLDSAYRGFYYYSATGGNYTLFVSNKNTLHMRIVGSFTEGTTVLETDKWYHLVGTYDNSTGIVKLYVNGILDKTKAGHSWGASNDGFVAIGSNASGSERILGKIDDLRVYNAVLSNKEIGALFNNGAGTEGNNIGTTRKTIKVCDNSNTFKTSSTNITIKEVN